MTTFKFIKSILIYFSSLKITLFSLFSLFVLVFISTLAQVDMGIYLAKKTFFEGFFVYYPISESFKVPIFLSGYSLGILLVINLITAHIKRFKYSSSKIGIWMTHLGLIILIIGSGIISAFAIESQMALEIGQQGNFTQSILENELVVIKDISKTDQLVVSFPSDKLDKQTTLSQDKLPFVIVIDHHFKNSNISLNKSANDTFNGVGKFLDYHKIPPRYDDEYRNMETLVVSVYKGSSKNGEKIGSWLLSSGIDALQKVEINNETFYLLIRPRRYYLGYNVKLDDFTHEKYAGTDIPKNFQSDISIFDNSQTLTKKAKIYMNHPLRFGGKTFFQASFGKQDTMSVFQVVENPGWVLPYLASIIIGVGLLIHFCIMFVGYMRKKHV